jgi:hypothetical protein
MALLPAGILPWIEMRFLLADGTPNALGTVETYVAGTATPLATYSDVDLTVANPTTIELGSDGRAADPIYLQPTGYKFIVKDVLGATIYTYDNVEDIGQTFASIFGIVLSQGGKQVASGYTVLATDRFVTVDSTGGPDPCLVNLLPADTATQPVAIKNLGTIALAVTPDGADTIEGINAAFAVAAAATPNFPTIELVPDGVSAWLIRSSHGL